MGGAVMFFTPAQQPLKKTPNAAIPVERIEVANIRDNTVTIFWHTEKPTEGYVMYGSTRDALAQKSFDRRDVEAQQAPRRNHVVTLTNLTSSTDYYYNIYIDGNPIGQTHDIPFQFKTARYLKTPLNLDPIVGKIIEEGGKVSSEAIVLIYIGSAHPLLAQAKEDGSFALSPCCIFNSATFEPVFPQKEDKVVIEILDERGLEKKLTTTLGDIDSATSVIALNKLNSSARPAILGESNSAFLQMAEDVQKLAEIDILFPRENALIPGTRPLIKGVGIPQNTVRVALKPSGRIFETQIAENKVWQFQPTFDLQPGEHTLELTTQDATGKPIAMERSFRIEKSGQSVLGEATPSATLTPEASPTAELITAVPSPTQFIPTAVPSLPQTGGSILPFAMLSVALVIIGAGMIFLL
ncbi:MAG: hypothetical protein UZ22_OP11002000157 [Microgenomates bacterium OLB23]|nr:MAG: hypothetical protein UZ22_OP11002000157 [Microgenomates bacterium OLB23]